MTHTPDTQTGEYEDLCRWLRDAVATNPSLSSDAADAIEALQREAAPTNKTRDGS